MLNTKKTALVMRCIRQV